jgi:hypothetical protein
MKRLSIVALSALGIGILACGGGDEAATDGTATTDEAPPADAPADAGGGDEGGGELMTVSLTSPWTEMGLPINDGQVVVSDTTHALVAYTQGAISTYTTSYQMAIEKAGWVKQDDYSEADFTAILFAKDNQTLGLAVGQDGGYTFAYLEDVDGKPESERMVKKGGGVSNLKGLRSKHTSSRRTSGNNRELEQRRSSQGGSGGPSSDDHGGGGKSGGKGGKGGKGKGKKGD